MVPPPHPARKQTASNRTDILSMNILFSRDLKIPGGQTDENLNFSLLNSEVFSRRSARSQHGRLHKRVIGWRAYWLLPDNQNV